METKYLEVLSKNILNNVKKQCEYNNIYLETDKEAQTDKKMLKIIKSIILSNKDNIFEKEDNEKHDKKEINSSIMTSLMQYYVALYNENLDLLHKLLDDKFYFGNYEFGEMNLFILDKRISSKFDTEEYIKLLKNNLKLFKSFYLSLNANRNNKEIDSSKIIEKFCGIIRKDNNIAVLNQTGKKRVDSLLSVDLLTNFQTEEILNLNDDQKCILEGFENKKDTETKIKLDLIKKYNFSKNITYWDKFDKFFTYVDILKLSIVDISLIDKIFDSSYKYVDAEKIEEIAIKKLKEIKKINPSFNVNLDCLAYDVLSIDQILSMTKTCADEINILCFRYKIPVYKIDTTLQKKLRYRLMELYCKDIVKRNIKKLKRSK